MEGASTRRPERCRGEVDRASAMDLTVLASDRGSVPMNIGCRTRVQPRRRTLVGRGADTARRAVAGDSASAAETAADAARRAAAPVWIDDTGVRPGPTSDRAGMAFTWGSSRSCSASPPSWSAPVSTAAGRCGGPAWSRDPAGDRDRPDPGVPSRAGRRPRRSGGTGDALPTPGPGPTGAGLPSTCTTVGMSWRSMPPGDD